MSHQSTGAEQGMIYDKQAIADSRNKLAVVSKQGLDAISEEQMQALQNRLNPYECATKLTYDGKSIELFPVESFLAFEMEALPLFDKKLTACGTDLNLINPTPEGKLFCGFCVYIDPGDPAFQPILNYLVSLVAPGRICCWEHFRVCEDG